MALKVPQRSCSLDNPAVKEFLDGIAVLVAQRILVGTRGQNVEYNAKVKSEREETKKC
jgi:hypothetical protein